MTTKTEQKERTHESILESAARLVRERGISGARVADVMKGAGLTVGGFYAHFASSPTKRRARMAPAVRRSASSTRASFDEKCA